MIEKIYQGIRHVGNVEGNVYKTFRGQEHFMFKYQGFGISVNVLNSLKQKGVTLIQIIYAGKNGNILYHVDIEKYLNSQKIHTFIDNDIQKFVSVKDMILISGEKIVKEETSKKSNSQNELFSNKSEEIK